ncbi:putative protein TPRXL [Panonychus citri]|uniref:putative protein TPRXL n=1 Tax=Panonychus citri TaxID=50023 RepID=UPI002306E979|nr:putative protein TPRXL [Panonychus citri]
MFQVNMNKFAVQEERGPRKNKKVKSGLTKGASGTSSSPLPISTSSSKGSKLLTNQQSSSSSTDQQSSPSPSIILNPHPHHHHHHNYPSSHNVQCPIKPLTKSILDSCRSSKLIKPMALPFSCLPGSGYHGFSLNNSSSSSTSSPSTSLPLTLTDLGLNKPFNYRSNLDCYPFRSTLIPTTISGSPSPATASVAAAAAWSLSTKLLAANYQIASLSSLLHHHHYHHSSSNYDQQNQSQLGRYPFLSHSNSVYPGLSNYPLPSSSSSTVNPLSNRQSLETGLTYPYFDSNLNL